MTAILLIIVFTVFLIFFYPITLKRKKEEEKSPKYNAQMKKLWQIAQTSMKERKTLRAEKALLTILKFDEKNAAAYNRLGILYAKSKKYDEAVECFEIAQSLDNNPSSIHNAGLIYLETGEYEKAAIAFEQAIALEGDVPARFIALAKAEEKLGDYKKAVQALENAYELDFKVTTLRQILAIYELSGDEDMKAETAARIEAQIAKDNAAKAPKKRMVLRRPKIAKPAKAPKPAKTPKPAKAPKPIRAPKPAKVAKPQKTAVKVRRPAIIKSHIGKKRI